MYRKMLLEIDEEENNNDSDGEVLKTITIEIDPDRDPDAFSDNQEENEEDPDEPEIDEESENNDGFSSGTISEPDISDTENKLAQNQMMIGSDIESDSENDDEAHDSIIKADDLVSDDRFGQGLAQSKFSIDRTSKSYKNSDNMDKLMEYQVDARRRKREDRSEKVQKRKSGDDVDDVSDRLLAKL